MKKAIISDIHSNLEAFQTVLADMEKEKVDEIYCLGDLVGYGPNPIECVDRMLSLGNIVKVCLLGNHDQATMFDPDGFNSVAEQAIFWTRNQLEGKRGPKAEERLLFMGERPRSHKSGDLMFVHGSPRNPLNEYVFFDDIFDEEKMKKFFDLIPKYCFQGHTHVPGIFTEERRYISYGDLAESHGVFPLGEEKLMVNVGSVGQPRDRDPRACYVILHDDHIEYRRLEYDIEKTFRKIWDIPELDNFLGERLKLGK